jgi:hypothetical protein
MVLPGLCRSEVPVLVAVEVEAECHNQKDYSQNKEENAHAQPDQELKNKTFSELIKRLHDVKG